MVQKPMKLLEGAAFGEVYGPGWCYLEKFDGLVVEAHKMLGAYPTLRDCLLQRDAARASFDDETDDEFQGWCSFLPGEEEQVETYWDHDVGGLSLVSTGDKLYHLVVDVTQTKSLLEQIRGLDLDSRLGSLISDMVAGAATVKDDAKAFLEDVLSKTNAINEDAAENYHQLGNSMEEMARRGGVKKIARSNFVEIVKSVASRWTSTREAAAAANIAAATLYSETEWSPTLFEEIMENDDDEETRQSKLTTIAGMYLVRNAQVHWSQWLLRRKLAAWKSDLLGPAKSFARALGVNSDAFDGAVERAVETGHPFLVNAVETLRASAVPAVTVMAQVAAGGVVAAGLIVSAGVLLDWYYVDKEQKRLGPIRETIGDQYTFSRIVERAQEYYSISAILSDEVYENTDFTNVVRIDPFYFSIKKEVENLQDDTAAARLVANTFLSPLINTATTKSKNLLLLPASISSETANHFQRSLPLFYFRVVSRIHSHPELWAARRAFELIVARALVADKLQDPVVMIGASVRQVSKMPRVAMNFGPILSGRDEARHSLKGTDKQRQFYDLKTVNRAFSLSSVFNKFKNGIAVSFFSTQDLEKQEFLETCIRSGISRAYIAINIPIVMMDDRIVEWDDNVMNVKYTRRGNALSMSILGMPVAGYDNSFSKTMSWVKPHKPIDGYDATVETIAQVGSSYLLSVQIGAGPQESHDTVWKMPDAGHFVLPDLTRENTGMHYFTVPEDKFNQVVKYVVQLNGAKNIFESTTGRILGLEAAVRLGGVTLDKSWRLGHREFVSVAVHAISCAGVDKSDAIVMIGRMREFFAEHSDRGLWESAKNGYRKFLGLERDIRLPGLASRGRHDYDVVKHWTCRQLGGKGWGERFAIELPPYGSVQSTLPSLSNSFTSDGSSNVSTDVSDLEDDLLNIEDAQGAEAKIGSGFMDYFTKWRKPEPEKTRLADIGAVEGSLRVKLPDNVDEDHTTSNFNPSGSLSFEDMAGQSRANSLFVKTFGSRDDLETALQDGGEFPAPDVGAVSICEIALKLDRADLTLGQTALVAPVMNYEDTFLGKLQRDFFAGFDPNMLRVPSILLDGLAGSAKSSVVRALIKENSASALTIVPSRKLSRDWRVGRVGTVVTRHGVRDGNLAGRSWMIIDEVYAYTKAELANYLSKAARMNVRVILMGDRKQQYEDGAEITVEDLRMLGTPIMRMLVSNTMPLDALHILKWASDGDMFLPLFQTRNLTRHSIHFVGSDHVSMDWIGNKKYENALVFKDRLEPAIGWRRTDEELGFDPTKQEDWLSISRSQGSRSEFSFLICTNTTKSERWFASQRGMFYVATSRHSKGMVMSCYQNDLDLLEGLEFEHWTKVNGRMTKLTPKEKFDAPFKSYQAVKLKNSPVLDLMYQRGMIPQLRKIGSLGPIKEDWRPWPKTAPIEGKQIVDLVSHNLKTLIGDQKPYAETDAVKYPVFRSAMGLWSLRRPVFTEPEPIKSVFEGMNRLAVNQTSKDEVLDLKNVVERTARPRKIEHDEGYIKAEGERLFAEVLKSFFDESKTRDFSVGPMASDWVEGRTSDFSRKYLLSDPFGLTSASVRCYGFLKTQVKVKVKRQFAMEENYGQTVLASPADYNAMMGPWSKTFLRNVRLGARTGVFLDSGYSDTDLARGLRDCGAFSRFMDENYQADVKRQDTSHTPVTLRVFKLALEYFGVPSDLAELYERQSTFYRYRSLHSGLYDGQAENNLGSGDPFTLIRNIFEVLTVMVERFGSHQLMSSTLIVKGDDFISDKIYIQQPVSVPEIRATQLTEDYNKPPYHAGRFLLEASIAPDPIRMICKAVVKPAKDMDRVNELAEAFYDRYVSLSESDYRYLKEAIRVAYDEFEPALLDSIFDLYMAMRDRTVFYSLVQPENVVGTRLSVEQKDDDCAAYAVSFFTENQYLIESVRNEAAEDIEKLCVMHNIPVHRMLGRPNDLKKEGVWLSEAHAWAVIKVD